LKDWDVVKAIFYAWGAKTEAAGHNFAPSGPPQTRCAVTERGSKNKQQILWVNACEATQCHNQEHHTISLHRCGNLRHFTERTVILLLSWITLWPVTDLQIHFYKCVF